jgi:serine/threonine protein kinase
MAEVYRAYHANLDRYVAIKVLHAFLAEDHEFRGRFEKEARNIAKLKHPNIVQVYDFDYASEPDSYYMVMELIEGDTLKDRLYKLAEQGKRQPLKETLRIVREAAGALAYAHSMGMIHRDVKPANLMLDEQDRVVLTDFGIAKMLDSKQLTVSGGMIGTPAYMSPEQGLGEPGDERSDIYSLGVILYQLLVGTLPYDAETALGVILMHVNDPVPDVRMLVPDIPRSVQRLVEQAMAKDPEQRYQTAEALIEDIEALEASGDNEKPIPTDTSLIRKQAIKEIDLGQLERAVTGNTPLRDQIQQQQKADESNRRFNWRALLLLLLIAAGVGGALVFIGPSDVRSWVFALQATQAPTSTLTPTATLVTDTPTATPTHTVTPSETPNLLGSATAAAALAVSQSTTEAPTSTPTVTQTDTPIPTDTPTATLTPTPTEEPSATSTPTEVPNLTQTTAAEQTATIAVCEFDYAIVVQVPQDGADGAFFEINEPYTREITLLNTGTCEWGENTSLTFTSGEDFNAGPRIFIRESVQVGEEYTLLFEGILPPRGDEDPISGTWQLRTRGQKQIGSPLEISVRVFDPGS